MVFTSHSAPSRTRFHKGNGFLTLGFAYDRMENSLSRNEGRNCHVQSCNLSCHLHSMDRFEVFTQNKRNYWLHYYHRNSGVVSFHLFCRRRNSLFRVHFVIASFYYCMPGLVWIGYAGIHIGEREGGETKGSQNKSASRKPIFQYRNAWFP